WRIEVRNPSNGNSVNLEHRILIIDVLIGLILNDTSGFHPPDWRTFRVRFTGLARRNDTVFINGLTVFAVRVRRGDAGIVLRQGAKRANKPITKIAAQREAFGIDDRAVRIFQTNIPYSRQRVDRLVIDDLVRKEDGFAVIDFDVAASDHAIVAIVI